MTTEPLDLVLSRARCAECHDAPVYWQGLYGALDPLLCRECADSEADPVSDDPRLTVAARALSPLIPASMLGHARAVVAALDAYDYAESNRDVRLFDKWEADVRERIALAIEAERDGVGAVTRGDLVYDQGPTDAAGIARGATP